MRVAMVVLLAGCDAVLGLDHVKPNPDAAFLDAPPAMLVQQETATTNATTLTATLPNPPARDDMLVMIGGAEAGVSTVSGGGVANWQVAEHSGVSPSITIWYGVTDGSSATVTLKAFNTGAFWVLVTEWSNLQAINTVDASARDGRGGGATITGNIQLAMTTASAPDLVIFAAACYGPLGNPTGPWLELQTAASASAVQRSWYQLVGAPGPQSASVTYMNEWDAALVGLRGLR